LEIIHKLAVISLLVCIICNFSSLTSAENASRYGIPSGWRRRQKQSKVKNGRTCECTMSILWNFHGI